MKFQIFFLLFITCLFSCENYYENRQEAIFEDVVPANDSMIVRNYPSLKVEFDDTTSPERKKLIMEKITKKYLMGKFNPADDKRFVEIPMPYALKSMYMRKEAFESFKKMYAAAEKDGISLLIKSATRPFDVQKSIWESKWVGKRKVDGVFLSPEVINKTIRAKKILRWSSMPSTSRHHWGTDIDLNSLEPEYFEKGQGLKEYEWLVANAGKYGFCQVYSVMDETRPYGYQEEKWHWSYLPISRELTQEYAEQIADRDISGFLGAETAADIEIVKKYVLGINPDCL